MRISLTLTSPGFNTEKKEKEKKMKEKINFFNEKVFKILINLLYCMLLSIDFARLKFFLIKIPICNYLENPLFKILPFDISEKSVPPMEILKIEI